MSQRFFYAIEFDEDVRAKLEAVQGLLPVEYTKRKNPAKFHLTLRHLAKPWDHPKGIAPKALTGARRIRDSFGGEFEIELATLGWFYNFNATGEHVFWVAPTPSGPLEDLAHILAAPPSWKPHVTLGRGRPDPGGLGHFARPIVAMVREVVLFETTDGDEYKVLERFAL